MRRVELPVIPATANGGNAATLPAVPEALRTGPLVDGAARAIRYVRISVTDRCNYHCEYCMPKDAPVAHTFAPRQELLSFEEIALLVGCFVELGVQKVRLTGGEPLVRADIEALVAMVSPMVPRVVMTSNGHLLAKKARALAKAGLAGVNVSLDSLDAATFKKLTGGGDLAAVIAGIDAAQSEGLHVKLNAVLDDAARLNDVVALCEFAWRRNIAMRFIEKMPLSAGAFVRSSPLVAAAQVRQVIEASVGSLVPHAAAGGDDGPARYWQVAGDPARVVGIISAISDHFCDTCNRVRVTATGALHTCLGYDDAVDLRAILRGASPAGLGAAIRAAVWQKRQGHVFGADGTGGPQKHMISMGG